MDQRYAPWHIAQVVPRRLAIAWKTDGQSPGSMRTQALDELFECADDHFALLDDSRYGLHAVAFEQQRHRRSCCAGWSTSVRN